MQRLYTGDLVCVKGFEVRIGVVLYCYHHNHNIYRVVWFLDGTTHLAPRAILKKIETDKKCP